MAQYFARISLIKVQMHNPDMTVYVHVVQYRRLRRIYSRRWRPSCWHCGAYRFFKRYDSLQWMVGRRGATVIPAHFSGRPMTSDTSEYLCQDIIEALEPAGLIGRMYVVPFAEHQREISLAVPQALSKYYVSSRDVHHCAEDCVELEGAKALVTGEILGRWLLLRHSIIQ